MIEKVADVCVQVVTTENDHLGIVALEKVEDQKGLRETVVAAASYED